jgi:2-acylglycerol O-acyltransferase 2
MSSTDTEEEKKKAMHRSSIIYQAPMLGEVSLGSSWDRRKQTLAMFSCSLYFVMPMVFWCWMFALGCCYYRASAVVIGCYLGFCFLDQSATTGTRTPWLRMNFRSWWASACDYLPLLLVKTADLPASNKYVLGYHPHGIISVGAFCAFATDSSQTLDLKDLSKEGDTAISTTTTTKRGFSALFPGIDRRILTLRQNFNTPFLREYFLCMGACDSSKETFRAVLKNPSTAVVVVVGGAAESLMVHEGCMDLILHRRRGFVREAIIANAHLVPVIGFGESNLYHVFDVDETSMMSQVQKYIKIFTGMGMPVFQGRSMFLRNFGIMAQRTPVCVVVGAPIAPPPSSAVQDLSAFAPKIDRETDEALNEDGKILKEWHAKYIDALQELHQQHKNARWNIPGQKRRSSLKIVK